MPKEYSDIKRSLREAHQDWSVERINEAASRTFAKVFGISVKKAHDLDKSGEWESWKDKHGFGSDNKSISSTIEVKAVEHNGERYVDYIVASEGLDKAIGVTDGVFWRGDNLMPECIKDMASQIKSAIGVIQDPSSIRDMDEVLSERPDWTGTGHEHSMNSKHIVPITTTVEAKAFNDNGSWKLMVRDKVNKFSQRADDFWGMVESKILNYASIEFKPIKYHFKKIDGITRRFVEKAKLVGKTFTGRPANSLCGVLNLSVKSVLQEDEWYDELSETFYKKETKGLKMEEEKKDEKEEVKKPEAESDEKKEEPEQTEAEVKSLHKELDAISAENSKLRKELEEVKALKDKQSIDAFESLIEKKFEEIKAEKKHLVEEEQEKFEEVKSLIASKLDEVKSNPTWETGRQAVRELIDAGVPITYGGSQIF